MQDIIGLMKKGKYINYTSFKKFLELDPLSESISAKTFSRDIQSLRTIFHAPIRYNSSQKGFHLTDINWVPSYTSSGPEDVKLLLLSERVSNSIMPAQLRGELANAVNSLLMKNETDMPENINFDNFQVINPDFSPRIPPEVFLEVYQAWENKNYLKITYSSRQGHNSVKLIEPHVLVWNSGIWYVKGFLVQEDGISCAPPFDIRIFALHRIIKAEKSSGAFYATDEDSLRIKRSGLFNFKNLDEVEIDVFQPYVKQIAERFASNPEAIVYQDDERVRIHLTDVPEYVAMQLIYLAMCNVKVIKPASLQETLRNVAETILKNMK